MIADVRFILSEGTFKILSNASAIQFSIIPQPSVQYRLLMTRAYLQLFQIAEPPVTFLNITVCRGLILALVLILIRMLKKVSSYWACQLIGWGSVAVTIIFYSYFYNGSISRLDLLRCFVTCLTGLITTHLLRTLLKITGVLRLQISKAILISVILIIIASLFFSVLVLIANNFFHLSSGAKKYGFIRSIAVDAYIGAFFIIPWFLIYYSFGYTQKIRTQEIDSLKLYGYLKELELKTIKSHLNPHFIFNALNSIRALIEENPERAKRGLVQLSNILRNSTMIEQMETVEFKIELGLVKDYLALELIRFEDRLIVTYDVQDVTLYFKVPPMMLQTLVENAIKHGISRLISGGKVHISSKIKNNFHELIVENSGIFIENSNDGFGISSTKQRLALLYDKNATFQIAGRENLVVATVRIPLKRTTITTNKI